MRFHTGCIILLAVLLSSHAFGQTVSIKIETHKRDIVLGEPLYVVVYVYNKGQQPVGILYGNGPSYDLGQGWAQIMIAKDDDEFHAWSDQLRPLEKVAALELKPGQVLTNEFIVLYQQQDGEAGEFAFPTPGDYRVTVRYLLRTGDTVQAEPARIKVHEPVGLDVEAWAELKRDQSYGVIIQTPWDTRVTSSACDGLVETYGRVRRSVYAQYLALSIGRHAVYARDGEHKEAHEFMRSAETESDNAFVKKKALRTKSSLSNPVP